MCVYCALDTWVALAPITCACPRFPIVCLFRDVNDELEVPLIIFVVNAFAHTNMCCQCILLALCLCFGVDEVLLLLVCLWSRLLPYICICVCPMRITIWLAPCRWSCWFMRFIYIFLCVFFFFCTLGIYFSNLCSQLLFFPIGGKEKLLRNCSYFEHYNITTVLSTLTNLYGLS